MYTKFWNITARNSFWWLGMGVLVLTTLSTIYSPSFWDQNRVAIMILFGLGLLISHLGFLKAALAVGQKPEKAPAIKNMLTSFVVGIGCGFFANSLLAELFGYSLKPKETPFSWIVIWAFALIIGSLIMFRTFKENLEQESRVQNTEDKINKVFHD